MLKQVLGRGVSGLGSPTVWTQEAHTCYLHRKNSVQLRQNKLH